MQGKLETEIRIQKKIDRILETVPEYVKLWYMSLRGSKFKMTTIKDYLKKVKQFLSYIDSDTKNVSPEMITLNSAESFMISVQTKKDKNGMIIYTTDSYQLTIWCVLSSLFEYMKKYNYIPYNYMDDVKKPKAKTSAKNDSETTFLTKKDFNKLLKATQNGRKGKRKTFEKYRNRDCLIMILFMTTGIKETALSEINISDIDFNTYILKIVDKHNDVHYYPLCEQAKLYLDLWLEDRKNICVGDDELFLGRYNERLSPVAINRIVRKYSEMALGYKLNPSKLRASFCSILYDETQDEEFVRKAAGHKSISTTRRYIKTVGNEHQQASEMINNIFK